MDPKRNDILNLFSVYIKVGLGIFDFCTHYRRLISKDSIFSPNFNCGCSYAERALWCRDSKRRALGNYFSVRTCYEFVISKCREDWDLGLCTFWVPAFIKLVLKKCTDLDLSLLYNLILGTYSKFARTNNFLSLCARRSHRRTALLWTLRWLSKFSKTIRRGCRKRQVGVLKRRVFRQCHFSIRHHEVFLLRSRSDFHVANFREHSRIWLCWFNLIHLHCSKINHNDT